jgi:hypothetical protein
MAKKKVDLSDPVQQEAYWTEVASKQLLGRKIVGVRYMSLEEMEACGWSERPIVFQLDDGNLIYPSMDDEGNGGGSLFTNNKNNSILPVLRD